MSVDWSDTAHLTTEQLVTFLRDSRIRNDVGSGYTNGESLVQDILTEVAKRLTSVENKIEYAVRVGDRFVDSRHFHASQAVYEYMNLVLAKKPEFAGVPLKVVVREVGEWGDNTDD